MAVYESFSILGRACVACQGSEEGASLSRPMALLSWKVMAVVRRYVWPDVLTSLATLGIAVGASPTVA